MRLVVCIEFIGESIGFRFIFSVRCVIYLVLDFVIVVYISNYNIYFFGLFI